MENWKRVLVGASAGAGAIMFLKGNRTAGMVLAGVSLATLASEYPEKFEEIRQNLPLYFDRCTTFLDVASRVGQRLSAGPSANVRWLEALLDS